jgi:hypothetical protein
MRDLNIQQTSNSVEKYYRQTDSNQIKKIYKTKKRNTQLSKPKNGKMDTKTLKKN